MNPTIPRRAPSTSKRLSNSASSAKRLGTGRRRASTSMRELDNPKAPAARHSSSTCAIDNRSASVAERSHASSPITYIRSTECPIKAATCTAKPLESRASR